MDTLKEFIETNDNEERNSKFLEAIKELDNSTKVQIKVQKRLYVSYLGRQNYGNNI